MTSTLKADILESKTTDGNLTVRGNGSGLVNLEAGFLVDGSAGVPGASIRNDAIDSQHYVDGSIDTAHVADDAITLAKVSDDAIGVAQLSATGTASSSVFLRGDNAWAAAGGGAWTLIGTAAASNSSTLDVTGLDSTYDHYAISVSDITPATNSKLYLRFGDSGGVDSGSDYTYHTTGLADNSTYFAGVHSASASFILLAKDNILSTSGRGFGGMFFLHRPGDGNVVPIVSGTMVFVDNSTCRGGLTIGRHTSAITLDRVQILMSSGNITSGRLSVWGIAHA